jgi:hypothetical protein
MIGFEQSNGVVVRVFVGLPTVLMGRAAFGLALVFDDAIIARLSG